MIMEMMMVMMMKREEDNDLSFGTSPFTSLFGPGNVDFAAQGAPLRAPGLPSAVGHVARATPRAPPAIPPLLPRGAFFPEGAGNR